MAVRPLKREAREAAGEVGKKFGNNLQGEK